MKQQNENLIFDIGMHIGEDTQFYLKRGYSVIAVEANPVLVEQNTVKFKNYIRSGQLTIVNAGIANQESILPFYVNHHTTEWSSFDKEVGTRNNTSYHIISVPTITTNSLFEKHGIPFYMKVDIEGFDYLCLEAIPEGVNAMKPQFISFEAAQVDWLDIIAAKGYTKVKVINQVNNFKPLNIQEEKSKLYCTLLKYRKRWKTRLQKFISFEHPMGSSGPFGNNTKGEWHSIDKAKELYKAFYHNKDNKPLNNLSWFDFHATFL